MTLYRMYQQEIPMTYTFDIAYDCPIYDFLKLLDDYNLKLESYITDGPGGGNPEITVTGTQENIENLKSTMGW